MLKTRPISGELLAMKNQIRQYAIDYGLDFFEVIYEVCDYDTINILAAQGGFPSRYPHWKFGMDYDQLSKSYSYGLSKIYEMVINTDPCYAYLLAGNAMVEQKLVMAHVYGHSDFFKNNIWFSRTNRNMMDVMANHGTKIRRYMEIHGVDKVEAFIDKCLSLENLLDPHYLFNEDAEKEAEDDSNENVSDNRSAALQSYLRSEKRRQDKKEIAKPTVEEEKIEIDIKLPQRDIMKFLMDNAPLKEWQADIIGILREEAYYFLPQRMTKIMNEGWASYWHEEIMAKKAVEADELITFADRHSSVLQMSRKQINPYKLGIELYKDILHRWDTGKHGKEYQDCDNLVDKENWDLKHGKGMEKIFEIRKTHNDVSFIDEFLTKEFCERQQLFTYKFNPRTGRSEIDVRDFEAIRSNLLTSLANGGSPVIDVVNANYENRNEILMQHGHLGADLDVKYAEDTMRNIFALWKRPVNLATTYDDKEVIFSFDGKEFKSNI